MNIEKIDQPPEGLYESELMQFDVKGLTVFLREQMVGFWSSDSLPMDLCTEHLGGYIVPGMRYRINQDYYPTISSARQEFERLLKIFRTL